MNSIELIRIKSIAATTNDKEKLRELLGQCIDYIEETMDEPPTIKLNFDLLERAKGAKKRMAAFGKLKLD